MGGEKENLSARLSRIGDDSLYDSYVVTDSAAPETLGDKTAYVWFFITLGGAATFVRMTTGSTPVTLTDGLKLPAGVLFNLDFKPGTTLNFIADDAGPTDISIVEVLG